MTKDQNSDNSLHILPCKIQYDGGAKISQYFLVEKDEASGCVESTFRGRHLKGVEIDMDKQLVNVAKIEKVNHLDSCTKVVTGDLIDKIVTWDHDFVPHDSQDVYIKAIKILPILNNAVNKRVKLQ